MPNDQFKLSHVSGKDLGQRKGHYLITMKGGRWSFQLGTLEKLSRAAARRR
jgi:hypothetical protein